MMYHQSIEQLIRRWLKDNEKFLHTAEKIATELKLPLLDVKNTLERMVDEGSVTRKIGAQGIFYQLVEIIGTMKGKKIAEW